MLTNKYERIMHKINEEIEEAERCLKISKHLGDDNSSNWFESRLKTLHEMKQFLIEEEGF